MKIRVIKEVPGVEEHNVLVGDVLEVVDSPKGKEGLKGIWVMSEVGERVLLQVEHCEKVVSKGIRETQG